MMPATRAIKRLARIGLHQCGGLRPILWSNRHNFHILTYHRFSADFYPEGLAGLDRQCEFLTRHFRVTPMAEIAKCLSEARPVPPRTLAVTVDDGYRDFLTDAMPVFERWKIPATVYLISDFIDEKIWPWWNQVSFAVMQSNRELARVRIGETVEEMSLSGRPQREEAIAKIVARVVRVPDRIRHEFVETLGDIFDIRIPRAAPPEFAPLRWDEIRELADAGIEFGAHTRTHPVLPNVADADAMREEIAGSAARIEEELGRPVTHFCYPNGDWNDLTESVVAECGFATAVRTQPGLNGRDAGRYRLKRLSVDPDLPQEYFREQMAGMHTG